MGAMDSGLSWRPGSSVRLLLLFGLCQVGAEQGILHAVSNLSSTLVREYCVFYNGDWMPFPKSLDNATEYPLQDLTSTILCDSTDVPPDGIKDKLVVVKRGNCTFIRKAQIAHKHFAKALLIASLAGLSPPAGNKSDFEKLNIPVALIDYHDILMMRKILGDHISGALYSPPVPVLDYSILIIFVIAVATVAVGSYWSGMDEHGSGSSTLSDSRPQSNGEDKTKDSSAMLTPLTVVVFVVICSVMIVLLYFFYKWLVYMVIGIFALAAAVSVYNCLATLLKRIPYWKCKAPYVQRRIEVRLVLLALFSVTLSAIWVVYRNDDRWVWILHDCLGVAFCLNFMKTLKMPHFKSCVILLVLLLIYDVFFVFVTPYFTKNHESIMVEVAAGSGSTGGEKLPVVIRVPRLVSSVVTLCGMSFSILGFGDIIVPGLLVAYCRRFDLQTNTSNIYFILCTIAYAVGMILTFIVLILTKMAQPALLYLVPCILVTCAVTAWSRKEMKTFWAGSDYEVLDVTSDALLQGVIYW
ncbi:signal peptide peptidase-like 2A isoform X2 [Rhincodon typus]|uniref:signal peptide peptidase-like 2A isoform X2 n=1 Tax=Rhincodon typus TaxID=259920 RepID=UPI00202F6FC7|nr:signal peptide peptidase-like 2A isoform X2 [Rhincodon typus]